MEEGQHDLTPAGNMRAPSKKLMVQRVVSAWEAVTTETIVRSFEACGTITSNPDIIHCTKVGGLAREASHELYSISEELSQAIGTGG